MDSEVIPLFPTFVWKTQAPPDVTQQMHERIEPALTAMAD